MSETPSQGRRLPVVPLVIAAVAVGAVAALRPKAITALFASPQSIAIVLGIVGLFFGLSALLRRRGAAPLVRNLVLGVGVLAVLVWGLLPSFRTVRVDEALPGATEAAPGPAPAGSDAATPAPEAGGDTKDLASGTFTGLDGHNAAGRARLVAVDGGTVLRLEDFAVTSGPDLRVILTMGDDPSAAGGTDLGALKGNEGNQNYEIPADVDPADIGSVLIWCRAFDVDFGAAPLQ